MNYGELTERIIKCAIEVHRTLGPGLLEQVYENAISIEFERAELRYERQKPLSVRYKGEEVGIFRLDFLIEDTVVIELKSVEKMNPLFEAQLINYLKVGRYPVGLLINFNQRLLKDGIQRFVV